MMIIPKTRPTPLSLRLFAVILLMIASSVQAKSRYTVDGDTRTSPRGLIRADEAGAISPAEIERRFRPYLEGRADDRKNRGKRNDIDHRHHNSNNNHNYNHNHNNNHNNNRNNTRDRKGIASRPSPRDYMTLMGMWDKLSPSFHALYSEASAVPPNLTETYVSPSGNFIIYYTTDPSDVNRVNTIDTIGYGDDGNPSAWRTRRSTPNGTPDYIDETAFALDSAWSMLVDRFGFEPPLPDQGSRYRVYVNYMGEYDYGGVDPIASVGARGFSSIMELNSGVIYGYETRPYDAMRVTCPHELFHSVQYAMAWRESGFLPYVIDDYPLPWLEGSATLMEEAAFPEVDDYLQYIRGYDPSKLALLIDDYYPAEYQNAILFKYLYEKTAPRDSIGFIKSFMYSKYANDALPFFTNLSQTSLDYTGKTWARILNDFHAESYFTGSRARTGYFVSDAKLMDMWPLPAPSSGAEVKQIRPNAAGFVRYASGQNHPDSLIININCDITSNSDVVTWAANAIVTEANGNAEIIPISIDASGGGSITIKNWSVKSECIVAVTNAHPNTNVNATRKATVTPIGLPPGGASIAVFPNRINIKTKRSAPVNIVGGDITEVSILSIDGKRVGRYSKSRAGKDFDRLDDGTVTWQPNRRIVPGVYFIVATTASDKKRPQRRKIIILP